MTAFFSNYLLNFIVGWYWGSRSRSVPTILYAALMTTSGSDNNGTGAVEAAGTYGYARVAINNNSTNWVEPVAGLTSNGAVITWPKALGGNYGTIEGVYFYDASTAGNLLFGINIPVSSQKTLNEGERLEYELNDFTLSLVNPS